MTPFINQLEESNQRSHQYATRTGITVNRPSAPRGLLPQQNVFQRGTWKVADRSMLLFNSLTAGAKPLAFDVQVSLARSFEIPVTGCHETFGCLCFDRKVSG